jgi:hypothetical protein
MIDKSALGPFSPVPVRAVASSFNAIPPIGTVVCCGYIDDDDDDNDVVDADIVYSADDFIYFA